MHAAIIALDKVPMANRPKGANIPAADVEPKSGEDNAGGEHTRVGVMVKSSGFSLQI
jgi:hypothetical protein